MNQEELVKVLLEREKLGSTGINDGVAIPHGKLKNIDHLLALFGRSRGGIDFGALDGKLSHFFFLLVAPESSAGAHLKALARISAHSPGVTFRESCMKAQTGKSCTGSLSRKMRNSKAEAMRSPFTSPTPPARGVRASVVIVRCSFPHLPLTLRLKHAFGLMTCTRYRH